MTPSLENALNNLAAALGVRFVSTPRPIRDLLMQEFRELRDSVEFADKCETAFEKGASAANREINTP